MDQLVDPQKRADLFSKREDGSNTKSPTTVEIEIVEPWQSSVPPAAFIPKVKAFGIYKPEEIPFEEVARLIDLTSLYRLNWGAKQLRGQEWQEMRAEFDRRRVRMLAEAQREGWIQPQALYGYFPVWADGNDIVIYEADRERIRLNFPRQKDGERQCLSDYFLPDGS